MKLEKLSLSMVININELFYKAAMVWMSVSPPNAYVKIPMPSMRYLEMGPLRLAYVLRVEPSWMRLKPFQTRSQREPLLLPPWEGGHSKTSEVCSPEESPHLTMLHPELRLSACRTVRNKYLLLISHLISGIFLQ